MARLRHFTDLVTARHAAAHLLSRGVLSRVQESHSPYGLVPDGAWIEVQPEVLPAAKAILDEYLNTPIELDADWENQSLPNLSKLNPALAPECSRCSSVLPMNSEQRACPRCGEPVDIVEQIVAKHGPDALAACFESDESVGTLPDDVVQSLILSCPACGYSLAGLRLVGTCPECGGRYSKRDIIDSI